MRLIFTWVLQSGETSRREERSPGRSSRIRSNKQWRCQQESLRKTGGSWWSGWIRKCVGSSS